jgi:Asp/Glu/hydantoin racemase
MIDPKIQLIHATPLAVEPVVAVFGAEWPEARCRNLLDDSLSVDLDAAGGMTPAMVDRVSTLVGYAQAQGVAAVLFTCSAFGPAIDAAKRVHPLPVLRPNEAMYTEALDLCALRGAGARIGLLTTFGPAAQPMADELRADLVSRGVVAHLETVCVPGALRCLQQGDLGGHDQLLRDAASAMPPCDVYLLGQFSMARAQGLLETTLGRPVLSSPGSAVRHLKAALAAPHP